jgi:hypothetical protein
VVTGDRCILAFGTGAATHCHFDGAVTLTCSDVYGNSGGDWTDCIAGQDGSNGNFSGDPLFCGPDTLDFRLESGSPCLDAPGCGLLGAVVDSCGGLSAMSVDGEAPPAFGLLFDGPNPSGRETEIAFSLPEPASVTLTVHDALGREIAVLVQRGYAAGTHRVSWNSTDRQGRQVAPGVYFCRLEAGRRVLNEKIVLLR